MMACVKTGAHIYLEPYGEYAYGDAFEVDQIAYFRIVETRRSPIRPKLHYTVQFFENWFDQHSGGVSTLITKSETFINHGYDGKEISNATRTSN